MSASTTPRASPSSQILPDEKKQSAVAFLKASVAYYASLGIVVQRVMTDNGACYKSHAFRDACRRLGLRHVRTKAEGWLRRHALVKIRKAGQIGPRTGVHLENVG